MGTRSRWSWARTRRSRTCSRWPRSTIGYGRSRPRGRHFIRSAPETELADRFAAIVESSDDAILSKDRTGTITSWNPAATEIYGWTAEEAIGSHISILIPEDLSGDEQRILDRVFSGKPVDHYETERVTKHGRRIVVSLSVSPIANADGEIVNASVIARDVTRIHRTRALAARLNDLTAALSAEITPERAIEVLLEQAVGALGADAGALGLLDRTGTQIELVGASGYSEQGLAGWQSFPLAAEVPMAEAIRTRQAVWTTSTEELKARFPVHANAEIRFKSLAVIPLSIEGEAIGALALSFLSDREFDPEEQAFLGSAAHQAAQTLGRARIYEAQRLAAERLAFLAEASELLAGSLDPTATMARLADLAVGRIADWCAIDLAEENGELRSVAVAHIDPARVNMAQELRSRYPVDRDAETGAPNVVRTGRSELYPEIPDEMLVQGAQDEEHLRLMRELGLVSAMAVPLTARGKTFGAITLVAAESGRRFDDADLSLAEDLARRAALAIDNALLFRREHEAAVTLQRSLLPESLPLLEGYRFAARYEPAAAGLEVGGDWYEVVVRDDGSVEAMIGDVAGRGIRAASIMGRVRPALRAYAGEGHGPAEALRRLDALLKESDRPEMTTVFLVEFDAATGSAEYIRAGHPPALLRRPDGRVEELAGGGTPPLGILDELEFRTHRAELEPGSVLLLYTDGLIERRDEPLRAGLGRLKESFAQAPADADACLEAIVADFSADAIPDDVAMLAVARERA